VSSLRVPISSTTSRSPSSLYGLLPQPGSYSLRHSTTNITSRRNPGRAMLPSYAMNIERTRSSSDAVSLASQPGIVSLTLTRLVQLVFPTSITLAKKVSTTFSSLTYLAPPSRTCSITVTGDSPSRPSSWLRSKWFVVLPRRRLALEADFAIAVPGTNDPREEPHLPRY